MSNFQMDDYVDVAERIRQFREQHPEGSLQPADVSSPYTVQTIGDQTFIAVVAAAYRSQDDQRPGIGMAYETFPGRTPYTRGSELQNAETSAWGRAIVAALAADTKKIASADEVRNRQAERDQADAQAATKKLRQDISTLCEGKGWSVEAASKYFVDLYKVPATRGTEQQLGEFLDLLKANGLPAAEEDAE